MFGVDSLPRLVQPQPKPFVTDDYWIRFHDSLSAARFLVWLANEVFTDLLLARPYDLDIMLRRVNQNRSGALQAKAERFINRRYSLPFLSTPPRITSVFRTVICHRLIRFDDHK